MANNSEVPTGRSRHYDELSSLAQAAIRAEWSKRIAERRESLDLIRDFETAGRPYAVLDDAGEVVIHNGEGRDLDNAT